MRKNTAAKVADLLALVAAWLEDGRPRKLPGKPRVEIIDNYGKPMSKVDFGELWKVSKVSLTGAFKLSAIEQGYSRYIRELAQGELVWAYYDKHALIQYPTLAEIDAGEMDTRELIRTARAARRDIERTYLS